MGGAKVASLVGCKLRDWRVDGQGHLVLSLASTDTSDGRVFVPRHWVLSLAEWLKMAEWLEVPVKTAARL